MVQLSAQEAIQKFKQPAPAGATLSAQEAISKFKKPLSAQEAIQKFRQQPPAQPTTEQLAAQPFDPARVSEFSRRLEAEQQQAIQQIGEAALIQTGTPQEQVQSESFEVFTKRIEAGRAADFIEQNDLTTIPSETPAEQVDVLRAGFKEVQKRKADRIGVVRKVLAGVGVEFLGALREVGEIAEKGLVPAVGKVIKATAEEPEAFTRELEAVEGTTPFEIGREIAKTAPALPLSGAIGTSIGSGLSKLLPQAARRVGRGVLTSSAAFGAFEGITTGDPKRVAGGLVVGAGLGFVPPAVSKLFKAAKRELTSASKTLPNVNKLAREQAAIRQAIEAPKQKEFPFMRQFRESAAKEGVSPKKFLPNVSELQKHGLSMDDIVKNPELEETFEGMLHGFKETPDARVPIQHNFLQSNSKVIQGFHKRMEAQGTAGRGIVRLGKQSINEARKLESRWLAEYKKITKKLKKNELLELQKVMRGRIPPTSSKVQIANSEMEALKVRIRGEGLDTGMEIGFLDDYVPLYLKKDFAVNAELRSTLAKDIVEKGLVQNADEAERMITELDSFLAGVQESNAGSEIGNILTPGQLKKFGSFDFERQLTDPVLIDILESVGAVETDLNRIFAERYIPQAARRAGQARFFGPNNENFESLKQILKEERGNVKFAEKYMDEVIQGKSDFNRKRNLLTNIFRVPSLVLTMGKSAIAQFEAFRGIPTLTDIPSTLRGLVDFARAPIKTNAFANDIGAIINDVPRDLINISQVRTYTGLDEINRALTKTLGGFLKVVGVKRADNFTRAAAVSVGRRWIPRAFQQLQSGRLSPRRQANLLGRLKRNIPEIERSLDRGFMTTREFENGLQELSNRAVGTPLAGELPVFFNTEYGKFFTTLKRTTTAISSTLNTEVFNPAARWLITGGKQGSMRPLLKHMTFAQALGFPIAELKAAISGRDRSELPFSMWMIDNWVNATAIGIAGDLVFRLFANKAKGEFRAPTSRDFFLQAGREAVGPAGTVPVEVLTGEGARLPTVQLGRRVLGIEEPSGRERVRKRERTRTRTRERSR